MTPEARFDVDYGRLNVPVRGDTVVCIRTSLERNVLRDHPSAEGKSPHPLVVALGFPVVVLMLLIPFAVVSYWGARLVVVIAHALGAHVGLGTTTLVLFALLLLPSLTWVAVRRRKS